MHSPSYLSKVVDVDELARLSKKAQKRGLRRVLSHGKFEVMHPGHMRHLEWAKKQGDLLFVTLSEDTDGWSSRIPAAARAEYVAALYMVDYVATLPCLDATESIRRIEPDVLVRGQEFRTLRRKVAEREQEAVDRYGGELVYSSGLGGYGVFTSGDGVVDSRSDVPSSLQQLLGRRGIRLSRLEEVLSRFPDLTVGVVGDCMVDEYIFCDALGMSAEDPVIVVRPKNTRRYLGGAAIVAEHARGLGANTHFFSVTGDDEAADFVRTQGEENGATYHLLTDPSRPTTVKQRFLAGGKKLLRVSYLEERPIADSLSDALVQAVEEHMDRLDLLIFSDFSYGVNCPQVIERIGQLAKKGNTIVTADVQCSSQIATVTKYENVHLITPTEREARMSLWDMDSGLVELGLRLLKQTGDRDLVIKLGENGLLILNGRWENGKLSDARTEYLTSFATDVKDAMGAGDALLAATSLGLAAGGNIFEASILGNVAAAEEVLQIGNCPVTRTQLESRLSHLLEPVLEEASR